MAATEDRAASADGSHDDTQLSLLPGIDGLRPTFAQVKFSGGVDLQGYDQRDVDLIGRLGFGSKVALVMVTADDVDLSAGTLDLQSAVVLEGNVLAKGHVAGTDGEGYMQNHALQVKVKLHSLTHAPGDDDPED